MGWGVGEGREAARAGSDISFEVWLGRCLSVLSVWLTGLGRGSLVYTEVWTKGGKKGDSCRLARWAWVL